MKSAVPTTEAAKRIAALFRRRPTTPWDEKEIKQFKKLARIKCFETLDDLALVERYYFAERKKRSRGQPGFDRRKLLTFLNNFTGEVDKAKDWEELRPAKKTKAEHKIIQMPGTFNPTKKEIESAFQRMKREAGR